MRVGFSDPQGPKVWRTIPYLVSTLMMLFAIAGPIFGVAATMVGLGAIALFNAAGVVNLRQRKPRSAELECGPGYVQIKRAGSRNQRIFARDISGGTTARVPTGLLLTLQHGRREQPITIEVGNDADAEKVRHALGIGHSGFGTIAWRTESDGTSRSAFVGRLLAASICLLTIMTTLGISPEAGVVVGLSLGFFAFIGAIFGIGGLRTRAPPPSIVMTAEGLQLKTKHGWFALPYGSMLGVASQPGTFFFSVPEPYRSVVVERVRTMMGGPSESDQRVIVAQINAAAERARGLGPHKNDVTGRVDVLRRNGESPREWLVRLDMAGQMLSSGPGYRGHSLDAEDLWTILEDPESDADLRAAAARVLRHSPASEARVRIKAAVAAVRDESTNRRLRVAIRDDLDGASQELAYLDAAEAQLQASAPGRSRTRATQ